MLNGKVVDRLKFIQRLLSQPPLERQLDEIEEMMNMFNLNAINFNTLGLDISNNYYKQDVKDLHQLIVQHMQYNFYKTKQKVIKHKDSCKFNCFLIIEGQVDVYDCQEGETPLYTFRFGDVFLDHNILKKEGKQLIFIFHPNTQAGQTKYEDILDTLQDKYTNQEGRGNRFLQFNYLLSKLNLKFFKDFISNLSYEEYVNGETVFEQKDKVSAFYIIKSGEFKILKDFAVSEFVKQEEVELSQDEKVLEELFVSKKNQTKKLCLGVMLEQEIFGEEELIKSYFFQLEQSQNQQVPKDFSPELFRGYSVQCCSTQGELIKVSYQDLYRKILGRLKLEQISDLVVKINSKGKNQERKVRKMLSSIKPFQKYLISEQLQDSSTELVRSAPRLFSSSSSLSKTPKVKASFIGSNTPKPSIYRGRIHSMQIKSTSFLQMHNQDIRGSTSVTNKRESKSGEKRSHTPNAQNKNYTSQSSDQFNNIASNSFSDKQGQLDSQGFPSSHQQQDQIIKTFSSIYSSEPFKTTPQSTPHNRPFSAANSDNSKSNDENNQNNHAIKKSFQRPASSSIFSSMKKVTSQINKISQQIESFTSLESQNMGQHHLNNVNSSQFHNSKDFIFDSVKSRFLNEDKPIPTNKRFSIYEKSTMETSYVQQTESLLKSPRTRIKLIIDKKQDNSFVRKTNQEKKLLNFEDKLKSKFHTSKVKEEQKPVSFIKFVPQHNFEKQFKVVGEKQSVCPTYAGLNTKITDTMGKQMKIQLIQPIFDRGYTEKFNKEMIKLNKRNAKYNYIEDIKEENKAKGLDKFTLLRQIIDKQQKIKRPEFAESDHENNFPFQNFHNSNLVQSNSCGRSESQKAFTTKNNSQNNNQDIQLGSFVFPQNESIVIHPYPSNRSPRLSVSSQFNSSLFLPSPLLSPNRSQIQSTHFSTTSQPLHNKQQLKSTIQTLSKLVEQKFIGQQANSQKNQRSQSYSVKTNLQSYSPHNFAYGEQIQSSRLQSPQTRNQSSFSHQNKLRSCSFKQFPI